MKTTSIINQSKRGEVEAKLKEVSSGLRAHFRYAIQTLILYNQKQQKPFLLISHEVCLVFYSSLVKATHTWYFSPEIPYILHIGS